MVGRFRDETTPRSSASALDSHPTGECRCRVVSSSRRSSGQPDRDRRRSQGSVRQDRLVRADRSAHQRDAEQVAANLSTQFVSVRRNRTPFTVGVERPWERGHTHRFGTLGLRIEETGFSNACGFSDCLCPLRSTSETPPRRSCWRSPRCRAVCGHHGLYRW